MCEKGVQPTVDLTHRGQSGRHGAFVDRHIPLNDRSPILHLRPAEKKVLFDLGFEV